MSAQKCRIESVRVVRLADHFPDSSFIGEFTDSPDDWAIERASGEYVALLPEDHEPPRRGREYRYFLPYAGGEPQGGENYQKYGKQDFDRMEALARGDWQFIGIRAEARVIVNGTVQEVTSGGLWGIESDSGEEHFAEVAAEQLADLAEILASFRLSGRAIKRAIPAECEIVDA